MVLAERHLSRSQEALRGERHALGAPEIVSAVISPADRRSVMGPVILPATASAACGSDRDVGGAAVVESRGVDVEAGKDRMVEVCRDRVSDVRRSGRRESDMMRGEVGCEMQMKAGEKDVEIRAR